MTFRRASTKKAGITQALTDKTTEELLGAMQDGSLTPKEFNALLLQIPESALDEFLDMLKKAGVSDESISVFKITWMYENNDAFREKLSDEVAQNVFDYHNSQSKAFRVDGSHQSTRAMGVDAVEGIFVTVTYSKDGYGLIKPFLEWGDSRKVQHFGLPDIGISGYIARVDVFSEYADPASAMSPSEEGYARAEYVTKALASVVRDIAGYQYVIFVPDVV